MVKVKPVNIDVAVSNGANAIVRTPLMAATVATTSAGSSSSSWKSLSLRVLP